MKHNNYIEENNENPQRKKDFKKKLPHLNENTHQNSNTNKKKKRKMVFNKNNFLKTFGNFSNTEKMGEIRESKSQAGSEFLPLKKNQEVNKFILKPCFLY